MQLLRSHGNELFGREVIKARTMEALIFLESIGYLIFVEPREHKSHIRTIPNQKNFALVSPLRLALSGQPFNGFEYDGYKINRQKLKRYVNYNEPISTVDRIIHEFSARFNFEIVDALQSSVRAGNPETSLFWMNIADRFSETPVTDMEGLMLAKTSTRLNKIHTHDLLELIRDWGLVLTFNGKEIMASSTKRVLTAIIKDKGYNVKTYSAKMNYHLQTAFDYYEGGINWDVLIRIIRDLDITVKLTVRKTGEEVCPEAFIKLCSKDGVVTDETRCIEESMS